MCLWECFNRLDRRYKQYWANQRTNVEAKHTIWIYSKKSLEYLFLLKLKDLFWFEFSYQKLFKQSKKLIMEESKHILIPAKFISIFMHLIATTMLFFGYKDNIITAYPSLASTSDSLYVGGKTSFLAANSLTIIGLTV